LYITMGIQDGARRWAWVLRLAWRLEAAALGMFWGSAALLPADWASAIGARLCGAIGPHLRKSGQMRKNLAIAFPELDVARREALVVDVWRELGRVLAEYPHLSRLRPDSPEPRLEITDNEALRELRRRRAPTIFVAAHLANWELAALAAVQLGLPLSVIHSTQRNPFIQRMLQRRRRALGCGLIPKRAGMGALARELGEGRNLGLLLDQRVNGGRAFVPFFGIEAETTLVPALLALRRGLDLTPVRVERLEGARFRVTFCEPIRPDPRTGTVREQAQDMTRRLFVLYEDWIRERPASWLCYNRRWPKPVQPPAAMPSFRWTH
jgi:Kdo2-lipid IVA lauroyltransferase/acyltransferase